MSTAMPPGREHAATRWRLERDEVQPAARRRLRVSWSGYERRTSPVYLDHAATTPMLPAAIEAMTAVLGTVGNASSLHTAGRAARRRMEESRETIAAAWARGRPR